MQGPLGYDLMGRKNSAGKSCKSNLLNYTNVIIATQEKESFMIEEEKEVLVSCISAGPKECLKIWETSSNPHCDRDFFLFLSHTASFWNIITHWTSPDDLTEKTVF